MVVTTGARLDTSVPLPTLPEPTPPEHTQKGADARCAWAAAHLAWYVSRSDDLRPPLGAAPGAVPALVALLGAADPAAARAAALALNNLALEAGCRRAMSEAGAVAALVDMVRCAA